MTPDHVYMAALLLLALKAIERENRAGVAAAGDAALIRVLATNANGVGSLAHLVDLVADEIRRRRTSPVLLQLVRRLAVRAAEGAVARAGVGVVQRVRVNADGTMVPEASAIGAHR